MARLVLRKDRKRRLEQGHPWVFQSEVARIEGDVEPGGLADIVNHQGVFLARAYVNPASQIIARILTYQDEPIDAAFWQRRIAQAWAFRQRFLPGVTSCRAVYGEADGIPGLIVDKYEDVLVVQLLAYGVERVREHLLSGLIAVFQPRGVLLRNDVPVRSLEGLELYTRVWYGDVPRQLEIVENGLTFVVDVYEGQKTGYFFDQRENRAALHPLMHGWGLDGQQGAEVLDCFCHTGSFAVYAAHYGAAQVTAVDVSAAALAVARENARRNGVSEKITWVEANAFDFLRQAEQAQYSFDVVILDPPAFAKSRHALDAALRGYKEINLRALKLIRPGGFLVTASCSSHVSPDLFRKTILSAAVDAHKRLRLVRWAGAGQDHPVLAGVDEGNYLKFAIYQVEPRRSSS
ncbi:MAG: class I SAM-dependent rRNA methyltransferase [Alicyclobacillus sp.]|nr:class I SAM-dependent rRNA methyltransferase [Alicyclobacillus sp.]